MERKTQALSDSKNGSIQNLSQPVQYLERDNVILNAKQSSTKVKSSQLNGKTVRRKRSTPDELSDRISKLERSSPGPRALTPVPNDDDDGALWCDDDSESEPISSRAAEQNTEPVQAERSGSPTPTLEDSWLGDADLQARLQNLSNVDKEVNSRQRKIQGMIGMSGDVMRDYYSIGPEATSQKACYAPFYGYLNKEDHQDGDSTQNEPPEEFRFIKDDYLKMFVHEEALVPEQPEYDGGRVLYDAVLWPDDPGRNVPNDELGLEGAWSQLSCPEESEDLISGDADELELECITEESKPERSVFLLTAPVLVFPPPDEIRDQPFQFNATSEVQAQLHAPPKLTNQPQFTFRAKPAPQQQNRSLLLEPIQQNGSISGPSQQNGSIPGPSQQNRRIPGPSQEYKSIPGPSLGYPNWTDLRGRLNSKVALGNPITSKEKRFAPRSGTCSVQSVLNQPAEPSRGFPQSSYFPSPDDTNDIIGQSKDYRDKATETASPFQPHSTLLSDSDSDEEGHHRQRFLRTTVSSSRRRLSSLSKGLNPQDTLEYAQPLKPESTPKPSVEFEKERNIDEWGEELDYEPDCEEMPDESNERTAITNGTGRLQEDSMPVAGNPSANDRQEALDMNLDEPSEERPSQNDVDESAGAATINVGQLVVHKLTQTFANQRF